MAVTIAFNPNEDIPRAPHHYFGLSTDTKPTVASPTAGLLIPTAGSTFFETDTKALYITYDGTNWVIKGTSHNITGISHGVKTVTTAGADEALAAPTVAQSVIIQAKTNNTSKIAVGGAGVDATVATGTGVLLDPGETITLAIDDLSDVFIDALVSGEGVRYVALT